MKNVLAIAKREIRSSFNSPVAYAVILGFLVFTGVYLYFIRGFYAVGQADLRSYFGLMPIVLAFLVPALTMRSWAEERRLGTYELLLTLPFSETELVVGKFLSSFALAALAIALTLPVAPSWHPSWAPSTRASSSPSIWASSSRPRQRSRSGSGSPPSRRTR